MENVIAVTFSEENEAYRAFSEIKQSMISQSCIIAHLALLKKRDGHIVVADAADSGVTTTDDTRFGGTRPHYTSALSESVGIWT